MRRIGTAEVESGRHEGYVEIFDINLAKLSRFISGGRLNSPRGFPIAPAHFGKFSDALLVGNHGDGMINAYDSIDGGFLGSLRNQKSNAIVIKNLWDIHFLSSELGFREFIFNLIST